MNKSTMVSVPPADEGFATDLAEKLQAGVRSGLLAHLHAVLVHRNGRTVLEQYFKGEDHAWDQPLGEVAFGPQSLHDVRSITKSVVGLLYGIALDRGLVPPIDTPLLSCFAEHADLPDRTTITVRHALTMTLGLQWNEQLPYTDENNSERAMENAPDRNRYVLEQAVVAPPGTRYSYSGGAVALLGALIARGSGMSLRSFAVRHLFAPLGIEDCEWVTGSDGAHLAASGLRLRALDLARIGELVLGAGEYAGHRLVPREWLEASFTPAIDALDGLAYGRLWFIGRAPVPHRGPQRWIGAFGNGGQRLWIMPSMNLSVVVLSGNYDAADAWITPVRLWREIVLANLRRP
jgi:CubicO group peptidase (beta-lactamase class C family)